LNVVLFPACHSAASGFWCVPKARDDLTTNIPVTEPQLEGRSQRLKIGTLGRLAVSYGDRDVAVNTQ